MYYLVEVQLSSTIYFRFQSQSSDTGNKNVCFFLVKFVHHITPRQTDLKPPACQTAPTRREIRKGHLMQVYSKKNITMLNAEKRALDFKAGYDFLEDLD